MTVSIELTEKEVLVVKGILALCGLIAIMGNFKHESEIIKSIMEKLGGVDP